MALFENGDPEEFLLFVRNFQMTLKASGTLTASAKIQYIHTLLRGEALRQLEAFSIDMGSTTTTHLNQIILSLGTYFSLLMHIQSKSAQCAAEKGSRRN